MGIVNASKQATPPRANEVAHQNKHIREAIEYAVDSGWVYVEGGKSHTKGTLFCPGGRGACIFFVYGTPQSPETHARQIRRAVDNCSHN